MNGRLGACGELDWIGLDGFVECCGEGYCGVPWMDEKDCFGVHRMG